VDWAAASSKIAFTSGGAIWLIDANGHGLRRLAFGQDEPSLSPDGTRVAFTIDNEVHTSNADGSGLAFLVGGSSPSWSPDGSRIAVVQDPIRRHLPKGFHGDPYQLEVVLVSVERKTHTIAFIQPGCCIGGRVEGPTWSPDGSKLAVVFPRGHSISSMRLIVFGADGRGVRVLTPASPIRPAWRPVP